MEPTHFLAARSLLNPKVKNATQSEIEAFYDQNGLDWIIALSQLRIRIGKLLRRTIISKQKSGFAPKVQQG
jgi:hypothetical protein